MMKFQNRIASLLTGAMLALNCISAQSAFAASNSYEKLGMTKLFTFETGDLTGESGTRESDWLVLPEDDDSDSYYLYFESENMQELELDIHYEYRTYKTETVTEIIDGEEHKKKIDTMLSNDTIASYSFGGDELPRHGMFLCDASRYRSNLLYAFGFGVHDWKPLSDGPCSLTCTIYGRKKTDTPDPSLSEITGTTTGAAVPGTNDHDYYPWVTDEYGHMMNLGTNAYMNSTMEITAYPQQVFALGEEFNTDGLKVRLIEHRSKNNRDYDISNCLQIRTDYDPDTPGEYLVYIRTDFRDGEVSCDDYLFYRVTVNADLTTAETTEFTVEAESGVPPVIKTVRGDVDCSGQVMIADAVLLARYVAEDAVKVTAQGLVNAELDGEEGLTAGDLSELLQGIAGSITL